MSNDYSALINGDESVTETPAVFSAPRVADDVTWLRRSSGYSYTGHEDENFSPIDEYKTIHLNDKQINITQEHRGQYIPFETARYYDNIDLAQAAFTIKYLRKGETVPKEEPAVNLEYTDTGDKSADRVRFGWIPSSVATEFAGTLPFEIVATGLGPDGTSYTWKTQTVEKDLQVLQGLGESEEIEILDDWKEEIVDMFAAAVAASGLSSYAKTTDVDAKDATTLATAKTYADNKSIVSLTADTDSDYILTIKLTTVGGDEITGTVDLPLESVVTNVTYNEDTKSITITLQNGGTTEVPVSSLISGLATTDYVDGQISTASTTILGAIETAVGEVETAVEDIEADITEIEASIETAEAEIETVKGTIGNIGTATSVVDYVNKAVESVNLTGTVYTKTEIDNKLGTLEREEGVPLSVKEYVDSIDVTGTVYTKTEIDGKLGTLEREEGVPLSVQEYVDSIDVTGTVYTKTEIDNKLGVLEREEGTPLSVKEYVDSIDVTNTVYTKTEIDEMLDSVEVDLSDYYTKTETDGKITTKLSEELNPYATKAFVADQLSTISSKQLTYDVSYNNPEDLEGGENAFVFYEVENEGEEDERKTVKKKFTITGGTGGGGNLKIGFVTTSPVEVVDGNKVIIQYKFEGTDSSGDPINDGNATWKVGSRIVATEQINSFGEDGTVKINSFDITNYLNIGSQKVTLGITDDSGNVITKTWTVNVYDIRIESDFDDTLKRTAGQPVTFTYKPYGSKNKIVHIIFNKQETMIPLDSSITNTTQVFELPAQSHGSYLLEAYITATISGTEVESDHIYKDIIFFNPLASAPVIGTIYQDFTIKQYDTISIPITVYDPNSATPKVDIYVDEVYQTTKNLFETNTFIYDYKEINYGDHKIDIICGDTKKTLIAHVEELGITINPILAGLAFDFNPSGKNNEEGNRKWEDNGVELIVSDNFDWINGGYHTDENGDYYFKVKAGTRATITHKLFADDAKINGKEFKVVFKTENVRRRDTAFLTCLDSGIGLEMKVEEANIYCSTNSLYSPYCEEDIIEFEFNINKCKFNDDGSREGIPIVLTYEDGVANRPMAYTKDSSFWQTIEKPITIGSDDCDVLIYRMKAYTNQLEDNEILSNFIADARNASEIVSRYNRNQIYNDSGILDPEKLSKVCPDLRIIMIEAPWFTNDKDNKVDDTTVTMIYENGDKYLDNWTCVNAKHSGQGTSSNDYGYSGRNLDLIMNGDDSLFTFGDGITTGRTITLTRDSVPTNYLNIKVNIASSENQNNAQLAERYNRFNPFLRTARLADSKVKDTMEFHNCVVFIRESDTDINTHREFKDTNWHFYGIGNVGDSKKTDSTRVNNANDPKECVVEIMDYNVPLAEFPTGYGDGYTTCPVELWGMGNSAYELLYGKGYPTVVGEGEKAVEYDEFGYTYKKNKLKSFGYSSYEFRYEMDGITQEQRQENIDKWREFYTFVVTSDDATFKRDFEKYFVLDSALYFYLFTERYTMVDNRAKNSFWHYGKVYYSSSDENIPEGLDAKYINDEQAAFNNGYRWDLTFGYDFDTALGIDNYGELVLTYGKEDDDQYSDDGTDTRMIYRAAKSNFFVKLKQVFSSEMGDMFVDREGKGAWSAEGLITQWDNAQNQFPEELWRLDIQRKYIRTFTGVSLDNSKEGGIAEDFLVKKFNGRKKYQRRMFERNQEMYMATKYFGTTATNDKITMRFNNPETYVVKPDFTLRITPYSDMYIGIQSGATTRANYRVKAGVEKVIPYSIESATADITNIYGARFIQAIGDLSAAYVGTNDFSKATRLQSISIGTSVPRLVEGLNGFITSVGSNNNYEYGFTPINTNVPILYGNIKIKEVKTIAEGLTLKDFELKIENGYYYITLKKTKGNVAIDATYEFVVEYDAYFNSYMKSLALGSNVLLEYLDIRNVTGLESTIDLSRCGNLKEIYAAGAGATGIIFATGGRLQKADLPKIKALTAKNLNEITEFKVASYENLESLIVENTPKINTYSILEEAKNLRTLRLVEIEWPKTLNITDGTLLDKALNMRGFNASGGEIPQSVISGIVNITNMRQAQIDNYKAVWPSLQVNYDYLIRQYYARFYNELTLVDTQLVDEGKVAVDPITRAKDPIDTPTKASTIQKKYEFSGWSPENFDPMYSDKKYEAQFKDSPMEYTISYTGLGVEPYTATVNYGTMVEYPYGTPKYSDAANKYYLFNHWDKSGYANANKTITAQYDTCSYEDGYFKNRQLKDLTPVELYMLTQTAGSLFTLGIDTNYLAQKELDIPFGNDFNYDTEDIDNKEFISKETKFNGTSTRMDTNEILMDGTKDFVLAIDFKRDPFNTDTTIAQSFNPSSSAGFRINCTDSETKLIWGTKSINLETGGDFGREMIVLRHKAGESVLHVYYSQKDKKDLLYAQLDALQEPTDATSLVFGCRKSGTNVYTNYAAGTVYWSKLWYADLGDSICKQLAAWPHEKKTFITCSVGGMNSPEYGTSDGTATLVLIAKHITDKQYPLTDTGIWSNVGGWKDQTIRDFLEDKVYAGVNSQYKDLIKLTKVKSGTWRAPEYSESLVEIVETNDHIFIPAKIELGFDDHKQITRGESVKFDQFTTNETRIGLTEGNNPSTYWTRTMGNNDWGFQYIKLDGDIYTYGDSPSESKNLRYMITI